MLITFSGLDGSGKSTLIRELKMVLEERGLKVTTLAMYFHVGPYAMVRFIRDRISLITSRRTNKLDGIVLANDMYVPTDVAKHSWLMQVIMKILRSKVAKRIVYTLDLVMFLVYLFYFTKMRRKILIMDRYFYDFLADIANGTDWAYIQTFMSLVPTPDLPVFVDVSPEEAFARKGEYSIDHLKRRRSYYQTILDWVPETVFVPNNDMNETVIALTALVYSRVFNHDR